MDMMEHGSNVWLPAGTRTPGGANHPEAVVGMDFPALPSETDVVKVGVIDTGFVLEDGKPHPGFGDHVSFDPDKDADVLLHGHRDRDQPGRYLADADGHGTFVTGLILREAPRARVVMCGVLDKGNAQRSHGLEARDDALVADAVSQLAADSAVQVINLSFSGGVFPEEPTSLRDVLDRLDDRIAVVAAAGNDSSDTEAWPAAFERVIAVGALNLHELTGAGTPKLASFSNSGRWVNAYASGVDVVGPFVFFEESGPDIYGIRAPQHFEGSAKWSGTSFAAALVSGQIARIAIDRHCTGKEAAVRVLQGSQTIFDGDAVWVRGVD